ncbi:MAG: hypothetical protein ABFC56_09780 [Clostridiaceae bacterium]
MEHDLISRSAAINAIHDYEVGHMSLCDRAHLAGMSATLKRLPTVDAVAVVRCKDCRYSELHRVRDGLFSETDILKCERLDFVSVVVEDMDFCSNGEDMDARRGRKGRKQMTEQERKQRNDAFTAAATPMVAFLRMYGDPHCTVIVTQTGAEMMCGEIGMPYPYPEKDPSPEFFGPKPVARAEGEGGNG